MNSRWCHLQNVYLQTYFLKAKSKSECQMLWFWHHRHQNCFETSTFANCLPRKNLFERFMASNTSSASIENIYARSLAESFVRIFREHMFPKKNDSSREVHKGLNDVSGVEYAWFENKFCAAKQKFSRKEMAAIHCNFRNFFESVFIEIHSCFTEANDERKPVTFSRPFNNLSSPFRNNRLELWGSFSKHFFFHCLPQSSEIPPKMEFLF